MLSELVFKDIEARWPMQWEKEKVHEFKKNKDQKLYVVDTPPPFPTGEFHMGHVINWCYIDFAARFKRMRGFNVLFPQGWDCHGFPTEVRVEEKHGKNMPKEEFKQKCFEWTREVVGTMKPQMNQLGLSIDWRSEYYTIHEAYHKAVQLSLLKMFEKDLVYRGKHAVLWCPACKSAIAKAETEEVQRSTELNYLVFDCEGKELLIATTRPELLHACVALLVHPMDDRFKELHGKKAQVPLFDRAVPLLADPDVQMEFGTGVVMVCTFGDNQDVVWAHRHSLPVIDAMAGDGSLLNAGDYNGLKPEEARQRILDDLKEKGLIKKTEALQQTVKTHDRCKQPVELLQSSQWFIKTKEFKEQVLETAAKMRWVPERGFQLLEDWTRGLEWDWCFSRQRVFGIPLPFWYCVKCDKVFAPKESELPVDPATAKPPREKCSCGGELKAETSVCDGWIDSSITPLIVAGWPDDFNEKLYPSALRPQGTDIIRTWAFYTIFRCWVLTGKPCFETVLLNGMVCGSDGRKMSKSLENYVEAKEVVAKASVDALRQWAALSGSTGKDNVFYWKDVERAQAFLKKLWNASRFVEKTTQGFKPSEKYAFRVIDKWMLGRCSQLVKQCTQYMEDYDFYSALTTVYDFFWHDYCDYYLEEVKYRVYGDDADSKTAAQFVLRSVLQTTLKLLAPFAAFTTEEIHRALFDSSKSLHLHEWPAPEHELDEEVERIAGALHEVLSLVRQHKAGKSLPLNAELEGAVVKAPQALLAELAGIEEEIKRVGKIKLVEFAAGGEGVSVEFT